MTDGMIMNPDDKFFIFCPAGRGNINHRTVISIFEIQKTLMDMGFGHSNVKMSTIQGADIVESRNIAASMALGERMALKESEPDSELWMIGIDDDVGVHPAAFRKMLEAGNMYTGVCVPQRNKFDFDEFTRLVRENPGMEPAEAAAEISSLVDGDQTRHAGIAEVEQVGTSMFIMNTKALQTIVDKGAAARKTTRSAAGVTRTYGFYELVYYKDEDGNAKRLSEDYSFCFRLHRAGIPVHAYRGPGISHVGEMVFTTT